RALSPTPRRRPSPAAPPRSIAPAIGRPPEDARIRLQDHLPVVAVAETNDSVAAIFERVDGISVALTPIGMVVLIAVDVHHGMPPVVGEVRVGAISAEVGPSTLGQGVSVRLQKVQPFAL